MKGKIHAVVALVLLLAAKSFAQYFDDLSIVGFVNVPFTTGSNLFNNPLDTGSNTLTEIFPSPPGSLTVSLWDSTNLSFDVTSTFTNGSWTTNLVLPPGTGALVVAPSSFTNTVEGTVLGHDGDMFPDLNNPLPPPPLYTGPNGLFLLGDKAPLPDTGTNIFLNILGRIPFVGEQVITLTGTNTYLGNGAWNSVPTLDVGSSAFLNVTSEPSPLLTIVDDNGQVIVSWPPTTSVWTLQTNNNLTTGAWGNYTGPVVNNAVTNPAPTGNLFYRLTYP